MSDGLDVQSFPAARHSGLGLKLFMGFHAISLASLIFAGGLGMSNATSPQSLAIAALVAIIAALSLTVLVHIVVKSRFKASDDPDILRLTPDGLEGRALAMRGINQLAWSRLLDAIVTDNALTLTFTPLDLSSSTAAARISAVRVPAGEASSAEEMAKAIETWRQRYTPF